MKSKKNKSTKNNINNIDISNEETSTNTDESILNLENTEEKINSEENINENSIESDTQETTVETLNETTEQNLEEEAQNVSENLALITLEDTSLSKVRKGLRWSYKMDKKIRLILYKLFTKLPKFITGNYRRRINL